MSARSSSSSSSNSHPLISSVEYLLDLPNSNSSSASSESGCGVWWGFAGDFGESAGAALGVEVACTGEEELDSDRSFVGTFALRTSMSSVGLSIESNASLSLSISENKLRTSGLSFLKRKQSMSSCRDQRRFSRKTNRKDERETVCKV